MTNIGVPRKVETDVPMPMKAPRIPGPGPTRQPEKAPDVVWPEPVYVPVRGPAPQKEIYISALPTECPKDGLELQYSEELEGLVCPKHGLVLELARK